MKFDIYINDLKPEIKEKVKEFLNLSGDENYDIFPLFTIENYNDKE